MSKQRHQIGHISACIAGDLRYSSYLYVNTDGEQVIVTLSDSSAIGGMDGPGGTTAVELRAEYTCPMNAKAIVATIKAAMARETPVVISRYGKPTKRFKWVGSEDRGLSEARAAAALDRFRGVDV